MSPRTTAALGNVADAGLKTTLELNILPIELDGSVMVERLPYKGKNAFDQFRQQHLDTHVVLRRGATLLATSFVEDALNFGGAREEVVLNRDLKLASVLWRDAMLREVVALDRPVTRGRPFLEVLSNAAEDDLGGRAFDRSWADTARSVLEARVAYTFDPRVFYPEAAKPYLALVIGLDTAQRFTKSVTELLKLGIDVAGMYAGKRHGFWDTRVEPQLKIRGPIVGIRGAAVLIEDPREGAVEIAASDCYLQASRENRERVLSRLLGRRATGAGKRFWSAICSVREGEALHRRLSRLASYAQKSALELAPGAVARVLPRISPEERAGARVRVFESAKPVYVFDTAGRRTELSNSSGLSRHGPYSRSAPLPRTPRVCVVCQASNQGVVEQFLFKFLNGIEATVFPRGFLRTYGLDACVPEVFTAAIGSAPAYRAAAKRAMEKAANEDFEWDCALVQIYDATHQMKGDDNPYLVSKALFLNNHVPVQQFRIETAQLPKAQLAYALSNMALATYSKIGGIPWVASR